MEQLRRSCFNLYRKSETVLHELKSVLWESTLRCNLNCGHCGSDCRSSSTISDADEVLFLNALDNIKSVYNPRKIMVGITGGEPLMRRDLSQIVDKVTKMGFPVGIVSNGYSLNPEVFIKLLNSGLRSLTISLDGLENEHNDFRNNPLSFSHALTAIKNAVLVSKNNNKFYFDVVTCVTPHNLMFLSELKDLLVKIGVENWRLFSVFPSGRAADGKYELSNVEFTEMLEFIKNERKKKNINVSYSCEGFLGKYESKVRPSYYFCRAGITNAGIYVDGKVGGCISIRSEDFIAGDLHNENFIDIWENGFDIFRNREWAKKGICSNCKSWNNCLGNGLHLYSSKKSGPSRCSLKLIF